MFIHYVCTILCYTILFYTSTMATLMAQYKQHSPLWSLLGQYVAATFTHNVWPLVARLTSETSYYFISLAHVPTTATLHAFVARALPLPSARIVSRQDLFLSSSLLLFSEICNSSNAQFAVRNYKFATTWKYTQFEIRNTTIIYYTRYYVLY